MSHSFSRMAATAHAQCLQVHEAAQCAWDGAGELVALKVSEEEPRNATQQRGCVCRIRPLANAQCLQAVEAAQGGRDGAVEIVVAKIATGA